MWTRTDHQIERNSPTPRLVLRGGVLLGAAILLCALAGWPRRAGAADIAISLAVPTVTGPHPTNASLTRIRSIFPADTRRCRRGYLKFQLETGASPVNITFTGKPQKHSFPAVDSVTGQQTFTEVYTIAPFTAAGELPMAYGSDVSVLSPMAFSDQVLFTLDFTTISPPDFVNTLFMYCLEY